MQEAWTTTDAALLEVIGWLAPNEPIAVVNVLDEVIQLLPELPGPGGVEQAMNRLLGSGVVVVTPSGFSVSPVGQELLGRINRVQLESRRLERLLRELDALQPPPVTDQWRLNAVDWEKVLDAHRARQLQQLEDRKELVDALSAALSRLDEINLAVRSAPDRRTAAVLLTRQPFGFSEQQAHHILDMPISRQTEGGRKALADEGARLRAEIDQAVRASRDD